MFWSIFWYTKHSNLEIGIDNITFSFVIPSDPIFLYATCSTLQIFSIQLLPDIWCCWSFRNLLRSKYAEKVYSLSTFQLPKWTCEPKKKELEKRRHHKKYSRESHTASTGQEEVHLSLHREDMKGVQRQEMLPYKLILRRE